jgi:hypothetical protein
VVKIEAAEEAAEAVCVVGGGAGPVAGQPHAALTRVAGRPVRRLPRLRQRPARRRPRRWGQGGQETVSRPRRPGLPRRRPGRPASG